MEYAVKEETETRRSHIIPLRTPVYDNYNETSVSSQEFADKQIAERSKSRPETKQPLQCSMSNILRNSTKKDL